MKNVRSFEDFLNARIILRRSPNIERAKDLMLESERKLNFFEKLESKLGFSELDPNYVVDTCYDIILQLIRAKMLLDGYKTDSHEAEVSYFKILGFSEAETNFLDELRYFRNGTKYYGIIIDKEYAEKVFAFMNKNYPILRKFLETSNN